jgi:hypothetical protein
MSYPKISNLLVLFQNRFYKELVSSTSSEREKELQSSTSTVSKEMVEEE